MGKPLTRNITRVFRSATEAQRADGIEWYARARRLAVELEPDNVERSAAVIAVLSPRLSWHKNCEYARLAYSQRTDWRDLPTLRSNSEKARRLLVAGEAPENVVSGPKVRAFWRTIVDPFDPRAVVVDRHALDVACGERLDDARRGLILGRVGAYDSLCDLYRRAAKILSREYGEMITPAQVQAVTWVTWREAGR